jgi:alginate O-acetyltransferase complex protein AlgI
LHDRSSGKYFGYTKSMRKHALKFFITFFILLGLTFAAQELLPLHVPRLLPAVSDLIPSYFRPQPVPVVVQPTATNRPLFENRDKGLAKFYRSLSQLRAGRRNRVRVMHFGDSVIWYERVARNLRMGLQKEFGDGGRGQVYMHQDWGITLFGFENTTKGGFSFETIPFNHFNHIQPKWLKNTGFAGWTYQATSPNAVALGRQDPAAAPWTKLTMVLRPAPGGKTTPQKVRLTNLGSNPPVSQEFEFPVDATHCTSREVTISPTRQYALSLGDPKTPPEKSALLDAVLFETDSGVSYSTYVQKGRHMAWMTAITPEAFDCGYRALQPDLVVFQYGINESASIDWKAFDFSHDYYRKQMREFFGRLRKALPDADVLLIGPYERLKKRGDQWVTYQAHEDVRQMQREMAAEMGFAFFDSYAFLGGAGHMLRMTRTGLATGDYSHLNDKGSELLGQEIYRQMHEGFSGKVSGTSTTPVAAATTDAPSPILFNSLSYAYFFIIVFAVAGILGRIPYARLIFLTLVSWYFYASWRWWAVGLMLFSTTVDYFTGRGIQAAHERGSGRAKLWLVFSLCANLGILFFFKYYDFFADLLNPFLAKGNFFQIPILKLVLPVGISFYTFQSLSYTMDIYRKHLTAEKNFWRFAFYVAFFPQLVAGPIVRATDFLPQMMRSIRHFFPNKDDFGSAVYLFSKGLFKKTLADWISLNFADRVFSDPAMFTSVETLVGVYAFGIQIYLDFSSYTDMAIASAKLMGFNLTINFNRPYVSRTITEFWRRWHISLSTWLRDYLYISLGGNRRRLYFNLFLTMLLGGLWHGAGLNFMLWGILHGGVLMLERATGYARAAQSFNILRPLAIFVTFHVIMFSWILFRCHDQATFLAIIDSLKSLTYTAPNLDYRILTAVFLPYAWQLLNEKYHFLSSFLFINLPAPVQAGLAYLLVIAGYRIVTAEAKNFIYFQF